MFLPGGAWCLVPGATRNRVRGLLLGPDWAVWVWSSICKIDSVAHAKGASRPMYCRSAVLTPRAPADRPGHRSEGERRAGVQKGLLFGDSSAITEVAGSSSGGSRGPRYALVVVARYGRLLI